MNLSGKTCLITGSSRGIGYAIAQALCQSGADVVVNSRRGSDLQKVAKRLEQESQGRVLGLEADISNPIEGENLIARVPVLNGNNPVNTLFNASIVPSAEEIVWEKYEPLEIILSIFGVIDVRLFP